MNDLDLMAIVILKGEGNLVELLKVELHSDPVKAEKRWKELKERFAKFDFRKEEARKLTVLMKNITLS